MVLSKPNPWFSFFGLIITEIVPTVSFIFISFRNEVSSSHRQGGSGSQPMSGSQSGKKSGKSGNQTKTNPTSNNENSSNVTPVQSRKDKNDTKENSASDSSKTENTSITNIGLSAEGTKDNNIEVSVTPTDPTMETELQTV